MITTTRKTAGGLTDELICSVCHERACHRPPSYYLTSNPDLVPHYSHRDGTALCWRPDGGYARPIAREVRRVWRLATAAA
jgi:hypothetical protein